MTGIDHEALHEALLECQKWSGVPLKGPVVVWRTSQRARSSWEALQEGQEWSVGPSGWPGVFRGSP